jgi:hypothetical protein
MTTKYYVSLVMKKLNFVQNPDALKWIYYVMKNGICFLNIYYEACLTTGQAVVNMVMNLRVP